ncbi:DUF1516 family protein [Bacillus solitudinis]|uniref:DUF1516 family protein n=1 Tax=Bacillus solitudinis TaxID=2014074 RepID=UPI000C235C5B|nr:DUF1516 family protein [Bacillus solitudinis]
MSQLYNIFYQSHTGSWAFLLIFFLISYFLYKGGKAKGAKIVHMVLRLFYIIMLVSGAGLLIGYGFPLLFIFKAVLALILMYAMEMILVGTKKRTLGTKATMYWIMLAATAIVVVVIGFSN